MNIPARFLLVSVCGLVLLGGDATLAATPTPTNTPAPTPSSTPTPLPQQVDVFRGQAWLNGRASGGPITATIGDVICSEPSISVTPADSTVSVYTVRVLSNDLRSGCGTAGATITFFIDGQQASQTAVWQAGGSQLLTLIAGPSFARFSGTLSVSRTLSESVVPFLDGQACGYDMGGGFVDPEHNYQAVTFSNEQQAGCGAEGAQVSFKLLDAQGNVIAVAKEKGVWHAWDGVADPQKLNLTMAPVGTQPPKVGNAGTGEETAVSRWQGLSALLLISGLGAIGAAAALRRRAWSRPSA